MNLIELVVSLGIAGLLVPIIAGIIFVFRFAPGRSEADVKAQQDMRQTARWVVSDANMAAGFATPSPASAEYGAFNWTEYGGTQPVVVTVTYFHEATTTSVVRELRKAGELQERVDVARHVGALDHFSLAFAPPAWELDPTTGLFTFRPGSVTATVTSTVERIGVEPARRGATVVAELRGQSQRAVPTPVPTETPTPVPALAQMVFYSQGAGESKIRGSSNQFEGARTHSNGGMRISGGNNSFTHELSASGLVTITGSGNTAPAITSGAPRQPRASVDCSAFDATADFRLTGPVVLDLGDGIGEHHGTIFVTGDVNVSQSNTTVGAPTIIAATGTIHVSGSGLTVGNPSGVFLCAGQSTQVSGSSNNLSGILFARGNVKLSGSSNTIQGSIVALETAEFDIDNQQLSGSNNVVSFNAAAWSNTFPASAAGAPTSTPPPDRRTRPSDASSLSAGVLRATNPATPGARSVDQVNGRYD